MRPVTYRPRIAAAVALLAAGGVLVGLALYLWRVGLERANQISSVLALFAALLSMVGGLVTLLWPRAAGPTATLPVRRLRTAWGPVRLDEELCRMVEATRSLTDEMPYPVSGPRHMTLSTVYVRQRVELRREEDEDPLLDPNGATRSHPRFRRTPQARAIPVSLPLERALGEHRHLLLEGGPGQGKSTTARQVCRELADAWLGAAASPPLRVRALPVILSARDLAGYRTLPWPEALARAAGQRLGMRLAGPLPCELIAEPVAGSVWFVVVDGLDEVPPSERDELLQMLDGMVALADPPFRLMITSRPLTATARAALRAGSVGQFSLVSFDRAALRSFAHAWFRASPDGAALAAGFLAEVRAAGLDDVTAVPLLATIAITVYERDPARKLPRNRHDLYEQYLEHLWETGRERRQALRDRIVQRLADLSDGRRLGRALFDRLEDLLEHLAVVRLDTREPLLHAAQQWLSAQRLRPARTPAAWDRWIVELLAATGVVKAYGPDVEFVHQSFAEHYAARVHARALPETFDGRHAGWRRWIAFAVDDEPVALAVLTAWTRGHDAANLLAWLLAGSASHQEIAARLVSEGVPAGPATVDACLRLVEHQLWVESYDQRVENLFGLVRRLPSSPAVTRWLDGLVQRCAEHPEVLAHAARLLADLEPRRRGELVDALRAALPATDVRSRPTVAEALVELAPECQGDAAGALTALLDNGYLGLYDREVLAKALAEFGAGAASSARAALLAVLRDDAAKSYEWASTAQTLVELDGNQREQVTAVLRDRLRDTALRPADLVTVARALVAVAPEETVPTGTTLKAVLADPAAEASARVQAAAALADLGARFRRDGIAGLLALLRSSFEDDFDRWWAADGLCDHDGPHLPEALDALLELLLDPQVESHVRGNARITLSRLDAEQRTPAMAALHAALHDAAAPVDIQENVARLVHAIDPGTAEAAGSAFERVLADPLAGFDVVCQAAEDLARISPAFLDATTQTLLDIVRNGHLAWDARHTAAKTLKLLGPDHAPPAVELFHATLDDMHAPVGAIVGAARQLMSCGPGNRARGGAVLCDLVRDPATGNDRFSAQRYLLQEMPGHRAEVARAYQELLAVTDRVYDVMDLVRGLGEFGTEPRAVAALALERIGEDPYLGDYERYTVASTLANLGPGLRPAAAKALRAVAADPDLMTDVRVQAADSLLALGPNHRAGAVAALVAIADDVRADPADRVAAARQVLTTADEQHGAATAVLRIILADPDASSASRCAAARELARLGDVAALGALRELLPDPELSDVDRRVAARAVAGSGGAERQLTADTLLAAMADQDGGPRRRLAAGRALLTVQPRYREETLAAFFAIVTDVYATPDDRDCAVQALTELAGPTWHGRLVRLLEEACAAPPTDPMDPLGKRALEPILAAELIFTHSRQRAAAARLLHDALADTGECDVVRLRAARALDGGGPADRKAVVLALTAWISDGGLTVADRCAMLDELGKMNPQAAKQASGWLREVLGDPGAPARDRWSAARTLLEQEPRDTGAAAALASLIDDPAVPIPVRDTAVWALAFGNLPHRALAAERLRALVADGPRPAVLISAADHLARYSPDDRDSAIAILTEQASAGPAPFLRLTAAEALSAHRGPVAPDGEAALLALGCDPGLPTYLRRAAAELLSSTIGPACGQGRQLLFDLAGDATSDALERAAAARALAGSAGPLWSALPPVLAPLLADPRLAPRAALLAAQAAAGHPGTRDAGARRLNELGADPAAHPYLRCQALLSLALQHPRVRDDAISRLWTMLCDAAAPVHQRCWAGESLGAIADRLRCPARNILRDLETGQPRDGRAAARLRRSIRVLSHGATPTAVESLRRLTTVGSVLTGAAPPGHATW